MVPPLLSLDDLQREVVSVNPRIIHLLYEGANTERLLINPLVKSNNVIKNNNVIFRPILKTDNERGITDPISLIKAANDFIDKQVKLKRFDLARDKVIVVFDLDVYLHRQDIIDTLLDIKKDQVILCYTNPAVELFLLLTIKDSYKRIIKKHEQEILENHRKINKQTGLESKHGDRFVVTLVKRHLKIYPKRHDSDFSKILNNIDNAFIQESLLNRKLSLAADNLTSNIAYVLKKISDDDFDIEY